MIQRLNMGKLVAAAEALHSEITTERLEEFAGTMGRDIEAVCEELPCLADMTESVVRVLLKTGDVTAITLTVGHALLLGVRIGMKMSEAEDLGEFFESS